MVLGGISPQKMNSKKGNCWDKEFIKIISVSSSPFNPSNLFFGSVVYGLTVSFCNLLFVSSHSGMFTGWGPLEWPKLHHHSQKGPFTKTINKPSMSFDKKACVFSHLLVPKANTNKVSSSTGGVNFSRQDRLKGQLV